MDIEPDSVVLVAVITQPRDLALARDEGWYRMPEAQARRLPSPDVLALYLTAAFGRERWSVRYAAPVCGRELVVRRDLLPAEREHPRALARYVVLQLGPLEPLPHPIAARTWRRLTFLVTTGARLLAAQDVRALVPDAREHEALWLRERPDRYWLE